MFLISLPLLILIKKKQPLATQPSLERGIRGEGRPGREADALGPRGRGDLPDDHAAQGACQGQPGAEDRLHRGVRVLHPRPHGSSQRVDGGGGSA